MKSLRPSTVIQEFKERNSLAHWGPVPIGCKRCSECNEVKTEASFPTGDKRTTRNGVSRYLAGMCKVCRSERRKRQRAEPYEPQVDDSGEHRG